VSLGILVKGSEGIVLAADSRLTLQAQLPQPPNYLIVNFDNAAKLLNFAEPNDWIGAITYGDAVIGTTPRDLRTAQSFVPEFEAKLKERLSVEEFAIRLSAFYMGRWAEKGMPPADRYPGAGMTFVVGGYNKDAAYGSVYKFEIPKAPQPAEQAADDFGITFGGQAEHAIRLLKGYDPRVIDEAARIGRFSPAQVDALRSALDPLALGVPYGILPLQDCIDLAIFLVHTTIAAQKLSIAIRGVGGVIDVAVITRRKPLRFIQRKRLIGEAGASAPVSDAD